MKTTVTEMPASFSVSAGESPCFQVRTVEGEERVHLAIFVGPDAHDHAHGYAAYLDKDIEVVDEAK